MRWSWHDKLGPRDGPVIRYSDKLTAAQEEALERERHRREHNYIIDPHHPSNLYEPTRQCGWCGTVEEQRYMLWTESEEWKCIECSDSKPPWRPHTKWLLDNPDPS
jgi:hypothetical protein